MAINQSRKSNPQAVQPELRKPIFRELDLFESCNSPTANELIARLEEIKKDVPKELHSRMRLELETRAEFASDDPQPVLVLQYFTYI